MSHKTRMTLDKIKARLKLVEGLVYRRSHPLPPFRFKELADPRFNPEVGAGVDDSTWTVVEHNSYWGEPLTTFMLRTTFTAPTKTYPNSTLALFLPIGNASDFSHPEALVYLDGVSIAAADRHHDEVALPDMKADGGEHLLELHGWSGRDTPQRLERGHLLYMGKPALVEIDDPTRDFAATARVAFGVAQHTPEGDPVRERLLNALDDAFKVLDLREPIADEFYSSVVTAHEDLRAGIKKAGAPLDVGLVATGHAHIDVAWLWVLDQTRRKAQRTFHTVLWLMQQFPDYHFTQSQPQLYDYIRQDDPALFEAIKEAVKGGRWEVTGNTWVEPDCNITGPESLARQFLLGQGFVDKHFGAGSESPVLWLPDVFGFTWSLPQLMKSAGVDYFMTIKLGWNRTNRLPFDSFWWYGIDGSRVLTHFSTSPDLSGTDVSTYNSEATPKQIIGTWTTFQQKELDQEVLMAYGYGDGGGGPTREMLENLRETAHFPGSPQVRQGTTAEFFQGLERTAGDQLPHWHNELYLEYHRGTYTTQSRTKRYNRKSEFALHDAEFLGSLAQLLAPGYSFPAEDLAHAWELVCLNQFHDILPGSSIGPVYVDSSVQYEEVLKLAAAARDGALEAIGKRVGGDVLLVNPTSFAQSGPVLVTGALDSGTAPTRADGAPLASQAVDGGFLVAAGELAPYSITPLRIIEGAAPESKSDLVVESRLLENSMLRVEFDGGGDISRIYDKRVGREVLAPGAKANIWQAFEDRPLNYDAWDIDIFYSDKMWTADLATSIEIAESGPLRATLEIRRRILNSEYVQRISLTAGSPRLDFETTIDWRERHILLKAAFPVDVFSPQATYDIQWGNIERSTHTNTSWDWARFEVPAHKWTDLSEGDYGVSLLNDCKYGHDIHGNVMRITLLRSPTSPDPEADQGEHRFTYSILPHSGDWRGETIPAAYALNDPAFSWRGSGAVVARPQLLSVDVPNVVIETIKPAEDGRGLIVRLYESQRRRGQVVLNAGFNLTGASRTNLVEKDEAELAVNDNSVTLKIKPYEIVTLRLLPKN